MYTIGQTDGVAKNNVNAGVPIASIKTYLMDMAKSAADLPEEAKAKADLEILASGEFAAATSSDAAGGTSVNEGAEGEGPLGGEAETGGGAGAPPSMYNGGGTGNSVVKKVLRAAALREQASFIRGNTVAQVLPTIARPFIGGGSPGSIKIPTPTPIAERTNPITPIVTGLADVAESVIPSIAQQQVSSATEFQKQYCSKKPYPECKWCQYATSIMSMSDVDILDYLQGIQGCLDALNRGNISWAEQRFVCPGQIAAMLSAEYGPIGALAGRTAAAAIIGSMALHGALKSLSSFATEAQHHDLKHEIAETLVDAIRSGGGGNHYVELLNDIICALGVDVRDNFRTPVPPPVFTPAEIARKVKAVEPVIDAIVKNDTETMSTPSRTAPVTQIQSPVSTVFIPNTDAVAQVDPDTPSQPKPYFYLEHETYVPVSPKVGEPLAQYEAEHGQLYVRHEVDKLIETASKAPAPAVEIAKRIVRESEITNKPVEDLLEEVIETIAADKESPAVINQIDSPVADKGYVPKGVLPSNVKAFLEADVNIAKVETPEPRVKADDVNPLLSAAKVDEPVLPTSSPKVVEMSYESPSLNISGGGGASSRARFENTLNDARDAGKDPETIVRVTRALDALNKIPDPIVLNNGQPLEPTISPSISDYVDDVVYTPSLITRNQVPVREMVKLSGIDLTQYELCVAYVLDQDVNRTVPPKDVKAALIPTILDKFPDW